MFARRFLLLAILLSAADDAAVAVDSEPAIVVRGMVCDHESGQNVPGVEIVLSNCVVEATVRSDATGKYEGRIPPGLITGVVKQVPSRYAKPHRAFSAPVSIAIGVEELTLPKIELPPGRKVRGQVVDDDGRPVPEAEVQICWVAMEPWAWHFGVPPEIRMAAEVRNFNLFWLPGEPNNAFQSEF